MKSLATEWKHRLDAAEERVTALQLYQGRAFQEATRAARLAGTPLYIISAGLGLIKGGDSVPAYSLTVAPDSPDAVAARLDALSDFRPEKWWKALRTARITGQTLEGCIRSAPDHLFVLAVSPGYLELVAEDLLTLRRADLERVRILGPRRETDVPEALRPYYMPYDDRLDGNHSPIRGTQSDFPQRAALHFVGLAMSSRSRTVEAHKNLVRDALRDWPRRKVIKRKRLPEAALRQAIDTVLRECNGQCSRALRKLRDQRKIACEQERFKRICSELIAART